MHTWNVGFNNEGVFMTFKRKCVYCFKRVYLLLDLEERHLTFCYSNCTRRVLTRENLNILILHRLLIRLNFLWFQRIPWWQRKYEQTNSLKKIYLIRYSNRKLDKGKRILASIIILDNARKCKIYFSKFSRIST